MPWQAYRQQQQQPNQGPTGSLAPLATELDPLDEGDPEARARRQRSADRSWLSSRLQAPAVGQPQGRPSLPAPSISGAVS